MVKIGDTVKVRSSMSKHNGEVGEVVDTNMFGQYKVEFEDGFVHPYDSSELNVVKQEEESSEPTESSKHQQKYEVHIDKVDAQTITVIASNPEDAKKKAKQIWRDCAYGTPIVLDVEEIQ